MVDVPEYSEAVLEVHELRTKRCRSCRARIIWFRTAPEPAGRWIPINADTVEPDCFEYSWADHEAHFATCPNADQHRRARS